MAGGGGGGPTAVGGGEIERVDKHSTKATNTLNNSNIQTKQTSLTPEIYLDNYPTHHSSFPNLQFIIPINCSSSQVSIPLAL